MASKHAEFAQFNDHVLILDGGVSVEYGLFGQLTATQESRINKFLRSKDKDMDKDNDSKSMAGDVVEFKKRVIGQFQKRIQRAVSMNRVFENLPTNDSNDDNSTINDRDPRRNYNSPSI